MALDFKVLKTNDFLTVYTLQNPNGNGCMYACLLSCSLIKLFLPKALSLSILLYILIFCVYLYEWYINLHHAFLLREF